MSYVLEPGDPGHDEQGFGCCDGEDPEDPKSCQYRHRLHGDLRSPGQQLHDFNKATVEQGREPFTGTAMESWKL
jgi:hypothetical protein